MLQKSFHMTLQKGHLTSALCVRNVMHELSNVRGRIALLKILYVVFANVLVTKSRMSILSLLDLNYQCVCAILLAHDYFSKLFK